MRLLKNLVMGALFIGLIQSADAAHFAEGEGPKFSISINPVTLIFPWVEVQFGISPTPRFRLNLTPQIFAWGWGNDRFEGSVYGGTISTSILFDDYQGWYVEPGFVYLRPSSGKAHWLGGQVIGGYEFVNNNGMFLNLGAGFGVGYFNAKQNADDLINPRGTHPYPTGNLNIGIKF